MNEKKLREEKKRSNIAQTMYIGSEKNKKQKTHAPTAHKSWLHTR